jgi:hypothetical protein
MIRIIVDSDADAAALKTLIADGPGLPEIFYTSGYLIQQEAGGRLRSIGGGGINTISVHGPGELPPEGGGGGTGTATVERGEPG